MFHAHSRRYLTEAALYLFFLAGVMGCKKIILLHKWESVVYLHSEVAVRVFQSNLDALHSPTEDATVQCNLFLDYIIQKCVYRSL